MNEQALKKIADLTKKINQHEKTISQLVEIIALTNRRLTELAKSQSLDKEEVPHNRIISPSQLPHLILESCFLFALLKEQPILGLLFSFFQLSY